MELYDVHTHQIFLEDTDDPYHSCILDVYPLEFEVAKESHQRHSFSCGVHPWYAEDSKDQMVYLSEIVSDPRIVAIGETGLDKLKGPDFSFQIPLFKQHIELSEKLHKPIIVHCVKAWEELRKIHREMKPNQPWIIHGFRGKPELTESLIKDGFYFSIGENFNMESLSIIPIEKLFCETDEAEMDIAEIYLQAALALNMELDDFALQIAKNVYRLFPTLEPPKQSDAEDIIEDIEEDEE